MSKYCKYCGGTVNRDNKKCEKCGHQFFRFSLKICLFMLAMILFFVGMVGSLTVNIVMYKQQIEMEMQMQEMQIQLQDSQAYISTLERTINSKTVFAEDLQASIEEMSLKLKEQAMWGAGWEKRSVGAKEFLNRLEGKTTSEEAFLFYEEYIVICNCDSLLTKTYHKFNCSNASFSNFWACNKKTAEEQGYSACSLCIGE